MYLLISQQFYYFGFEGARLWLFEREEERKRFIYVNAICKIKNAITILESIPTREKYVNIIKINNQITVM